MRYSTDAQRHNYCTAVTIVVNGQFSRIWSYNKLVFLKNFNVFNVTEELIIALDADWNIELNGKNSFATKMKVIIVVNEAVDVLFWSKRG